ncbi:AAA domain-containing protein [Photobacterium sp. SDRW27]|uniref:AAA domain-containing protein n=1 Tax=Photobacterium obscurum TaxID=2829490 RepID=UPI0022439AB4|nr:AAA domain-containing protein [Photobacterium obscurum]MCW8331878.1 AAA domain-containing protein [Photobacterium obscurum]
MKYQIIGGAGLHRSETKAVAQMVDTLPNSWFAYAGLVVTDNQGSMEIDTLIITADRLLLVELKEWNGSITYEGGKWFQNGRSRGKSPYQIKRDHALRLRKLLEEELSRKLGYFLHVEAHVVLCGSATAENLPTSEHRFTHTLDEFLTIGPKKHYEQLVQETRFEHIFESGKPRPNSNTALPIIQAFFDGPKVKAKTLKEKGFIAKDTPSFSHKNKLYNEFRVAHEDNPQHRGLLRRWDFNELGVINAEHSIWAEIALRETRVGRQVRNGSATLNDYMLRSVSDLSEEDVTDDTRELYELRRTFNRFDEVIDKEAADWSKNTRIDRVRALLAPFAELHSLGVGHRDIDPHNLWYAEDQKSIVVSGFGTASLEGRDNLEALRQTLQSAPFTAPEDALEESVDPYRLDVFMLAVVAYRLCFRGEQLVGQELTPEWRVPQDDPFDGALNNWFEQALNLDAAKRFPRADIMLSEFNGATKEVSQDHDEAKQIYDELANSDFSRHQMNAFSIIMGQFAPAKEQMPQVMEDMAQISKLGQIRYRCGDEEPPLQLTLWDGVALDLQQPGVNRRIYGFKQRIEKLAGLNLPAPKVHDYGLLGQGGLFMVSEHVDGRHWAAFIEQIELSHEQRIVMAQTLINTVHTFHEKHLYHGDLSPGKVLVLQQAESIELGGIELMLLGMLEFSDQPTADKQFQPANPAATDGFGRDCFAVYRMVEALFVNDMPSALASELSKVKQSPDGIPIALDPLLKALTEPQKQLSEATQEPDSKQLLSQALQVCWGSDPFPEALTLLEPIDGAYYFSCRWSPNPRFTNQLQCYITGNQVQLQIDLNPDNRQITRLIYRPDMPMYDVILTGKHSLMSLQQPIAIQRGSLTEHNGLIEYLMGLEPVLDAIVEKINPDQEWDDDDCDSSELKPAQIWQALADTEGELRELVTIESSDYRESPSGSLLYPYSTDNGIDLSFDVDDKIIVYLKDKRDSSQLGELRFDETTPTLLAVKFNYDSARKRISAGSQLQLESVRNKSSRELRQRALERVIANKSVIPELASYFDYHNKPHMSSLLEQPTERVFRELYDEPGQEANDQQVAAFKQLIEQGPVGVLQGPPGTGKTTFVSKFIHYLYQRAGVNSILLVGQSHTAVDNVAIKARELCHNKHMELDTVRIGQEQMIDEGMLTVHTKALQRQIQHKFHREYDIRLSALGKRLAMAPSLVERLCQLHRTLNPLMVSFAQCRRERSKLELHKGGGLTYEQRLEELSNRERQLATQAQGIVNTMLDCDRSEPLIYDETLLTQLAELVAAQQGYNNPENLGRFLELLKMSQEWMDVLRSGEAGYERFMLKTKQLVCGTLVGVGRRSLELHDSTFDWVIVDEAGRAQATELMVAMQSGKRVLLVGDHKQLPPFYHQQHLKLAAKRLEMGKGVFHESDFERAFKATAGVTLDTQYRMVEPIGDLVSECFYAEDIGKLHTGRGVSPSWYSKLSSPWNKAVSWIDSSSPDKQGGEIDKGDGRYYNPHEIQLLMNSLRALADPGTVANLEQSITREQPYPIGIITMYRQQKEEIEGAISRAEWAGSLRGLLKIDTVDSYQGQENKIIILSLVRDNDNKLQGFLRDGPRINVAISRAQERLLILGAGRMWTKKNNDSALGMVHEFIKAKADGANDNYQMISGDVLLGDND